MTNSPVKTNKEPKKLEEGKITETVEEYCEAIHNLTVEEGKPAIAARLAERMNVSPVTVFDTIGRLKKNPYNLVKVDDKSKEITLTDAGEEIALSLARRHRLTERFLVDFLDYNWDEAHEDACRLEHAISPRFEKALTKLLNNPTTCPHGNPIPGSGAIIDPNTRPLNTDLVGQDVIITQISEEAEHEPGLLTYLQEYNFKPGVRFHVKSGSPYNDTLTAVRDDGKEITIGVKVAEKIKVTPLVRN
jgi:DtxR family transcriptional regulator, Mn-dependent transcriptional regulator